VLSAGTKFGPYEITTPLGAGGMGEVYRARDTRLGRDVALKVLPPGAAGDPERRRRFESEARAVSALNHPNICVLHDIGSAVPAVGGADQADRGQGGKAAEAPVSFLVMELLDGQTLAQRLRKGPLPLGQVLEIGAQIADALAAAHRRGIVHRDLKPANVMLVKAGGALQAKLLDFGLAKLRPQPVTAGVGVSALSTQELATTPGAVMGTVPYMAPEQLEGKDADARTDLFAFGCVLYEMLTGRRAFAGKTEASVISAIMSSEPPSVRTLQPVTPPALERLVHACLAKDPDARRQHAADVADELRGIAQDQAAPAATRASRPARRLGWVVAAAVAAIGLVGAAAVWLAVGRPLGRSPAPARFALTMPRPAVFDRGTASQVLAVSRDGRGVVYAGNEGLHTQLYWADANGSGGWALPGTDTARNPFLSPDGDWLGFWKDGKILKIPLRSGHVVDGSTAAEVAVTTPVRGASWSDDGTIVWGNDKGLWLVAARGGTPRQLTAIDRAKNEHSHRWPSFLPGSRYVLFTILHASLRSDRSAIALVSLDTGRITRVVEGGVYARYLPTGQLVFARTVFARSGTVLAVPFELRTLKTTGSPVPVLNDVYLRDGSNFAGFEVGADGTVVYVNEKPERPQNALMWVKRDGGADAAVPDREAFVPDPIALSPDGQRLAVAIAGSPYTNIWVINLRDGRWRQLKADADCDTPVWSPAGDRVAFASVLASRVSVYSMSVDRSSPPELMTEPPNQPWPSSWSPDGFLAYEEDQRPAGGKTFETYVLPLGGAGKARRWGPEGVHVTDAVFSPDGRWIAYQSIESGTWDVWVEAFPGPGPKQRVSGANGGRGPSWSSDGKEIYFIERLQDTRIMGSRIGSFSPLRLAAPRVVFALPFPLDNGGGFWGTRAYAVEPGGQRVLVVQPDEQKPKDINTLRVIRNWPEEVKAKLAGK
jgi:eukaryotic-like serine/threonine-protein kinase